MREIKFRGKSTSSDKWVYGLPFYSAGTSEWKMSLSNGWCPSYNNPDEGERTILENIEIETLGQYTGLKDINGTEIYEGDILKVTCFINRTTIEETIEYMCEVYFSLSTNITGWRVKILVETGICNEWIGLNTVHKNRVVVVGNIYDNPELLKKQ